MRTVLTPGVGFAIKYPPMPMESSHVRNDFILLISSRVFTRIGDGFLRILSVLLVASKSKDPMIAGLVLVFRYVCEILINAISGPFIDKLRIRHSLMAADLLRTIFEPAPGGGGTFGISLPGLSGLIFFRGLCLYFF